MSNVETLIGRRQELAEVLRRRKVNICCVQKIKWNKEKSRKIGEVRYTQSYTHERRVQEMVYE